MGDLEQEPPEANVLCRFEGNPVASGIVSDSITVRLQEEPRNSRTTLNSDADFRSRPALFVPETAEDPYMVAKVKKTTLTHG